MIKVVDPGHRYQLLTLDGDTVQYLTFVKRDHPQDKYPGNRGHHEGTTLQSVIRSLIDRVCYVMNQGEIQQQDTSEDIAIINNLRDCLFLLEHRAMRQHGLDASKLTQFDAVHKPMCPVCGHVHCHHYENRNPKRATEQDKG
jgi:hypothetical protein